MAEKVNDRQKQKKGFLGRVMEKLDKRMAEQARKPSCGCGPDNKKGPACC